MKRRLFIICGISVITIVLVIVLITLTKSFYDGYDEGVLLTDEHKWFLSEPTIEFMGKSEHFSFSTGKVVLGANTEQGEIYNYLYVDDFIQTKKIDNLSYMCLLGYYGDHSWIIESKKTENKLNRKIKKFGFLNTAIVDSINGQFEEGEFSYATKENFADNFKLEIKYCVKENKCYTEDFEIKYK